MTARYPSHPDEPWSKLDDAPECRDCKTAIHDGDICVECWRDRRALAVERDREWWSA